MKKTILNMTVAGALLMAGAVNAADWNGPYVGLHYGYAENEVSGIFDSAGSEANMKGVEDEGAVYGFQAGYNIQQGQYVYGVELSYSEMDLDSTTPLDSEGNRHSYEMDESWTARVKAGRLINNDDTLIYVTAGYTEIDSELRVELPEAPGAGETNKKSIDAGALALGLGVEHMVMDSFSVKAEVLWMDMDENVDLDRDALDDADAGDYLEVNDVWTFQVGVNYNF